MSQREQDLLYTFEIHCPLLRDTFLRGDDVRKRSISCGLWTVGYGSSPAARQCTFGIREASTKTTLNPRTSHLCLSLFRRLSSA